MRTSRRLAVVTAVLGGGLLLAGPVAAQEADCDEYDTLAECPIGGGEQEPATGDGDVDVDSDGDADGGAGAGDEVAGGSAGDAASLPFTGGEVTMIALAGAAAVGGGVALTAAGRKRKTV